MEMIVISDLHLGKGKFLKSGHLNIMEDFHDDLMFEEMLNFYSSGEHYSKDIHLVLNGDIFNLIGVDIDGVFTLIMDEDRTAKIVDTICRSHPIFLNALKMFLTRPNKKVTYILGNHDNGLMFEKAQAVFNKYIGTEIKFVESYTFKGIHVEHGHRFDAINCVPRFKQIIRGPNGKRIINFPWGSLFCLMILPQLKKDRPHIDKVRPMSKYAKWCFFYDLPFFIKAAFLAINSVFKISTRKDFSHQKSLWSMFKLLRQFAVYPKYAKQARRLMKRKKHIHTVVIGHTHLREWRRFPDGKYYFNSGTWNMIPSFDVGQHEDEKKLTYLLIDYSEKSGDIVTATINSWQGEWKPFQTEQVSN